MRAKAQKWGTSLAGCIPKKMAEECSIEAESAVELTREESSLVIKPVPKKPFSLDALLAKVTEENLHTEVATGEPAGKEIW